MENPSQPHSDESHAGHDHSDHAHSAPVQAKPVTNFDPKDIADNKIIAALSYLSILVLIPLLAKKDSKYCQEHAKQGVILFIGWLILYIIRMIIPGLGWTIWSLGGLVLGIASLIAFIKCLMGEFWEVPVIGQYRSNIKF